MDFFTPNWCLQLDYTAISFSCQLQIYENIFEIQLILLKSRITAQVTTVSVPSLPFFLNLVWHVNQAKSVEHPIDVGHAPNITQRFRTVNYCSDLFYIAQRQQHRAPRQTFAVLSPVNPELFCVSSAQKSSNTSELVQTI